MFNLPNLSSKALLLSGASLAAILITAPAQATIITGMTGRGAAQINMTTPPPRPAGFGGATTPDQAKQATSQSSADFSTALARIQAQMSAQATARSAAIAGPNNLGADPNHPGQQLPDVPNGLGAGGLVAHANPSSSDIANGLVWENANAPTQATNGAQTTVTVQQNAQKAILTWDSFNVGKNTTVHFDQSQGTQSDGTNNWIALNRVVDPSDRPSQILGNITAEGTVYLINRNGIIFGGSSQVNVHSFIAGALPIFSQNGQTGASGVLDSLVDANNTFRTGGLEKTNNVQFGGAYDPAHPFGDIIIEAGADIATGDTGFSLIVGQNVSNAGAVTAVNGQTTLAAGVGVQVLPASASPNGLADVITVGQGTISANGDGTFFDNTPESAVVNTGLIGSTRGSVTLLGYSVTQSGTVFATSSITRPGSVTIHAFDEAFSSTDYQRQGPLTLVAGSVTAILPDEDGETTTSTSAADDAFTPGTMTLVGGSLTLQNGSLVEAPGALVSLGASIQAVRTGDAMGVKGRLFIDNGAVVDVAGMADVQLPVSVNAVDVARIGQNELADSPVQQNGFLYTKSITVDARDSGVRADGESWVGTPLANVSGYVDLVPRKIDQMLVNAGSIDLGGGEVITMPGSILNLQGGYVHYQGGIVQTTRLIGADGGIYSIDNADPNMTYTGFAGLDTVNHDRWAITDSYTNALISGALGQYETDYIQGGNGGHLSIFAGGLGGQTALGSLGFAVLNGDILAQAYAGRHQVADGDTPSAGVFQIGNVSPDTAKGPSNGGSLSSLVEPNSQNAPTTEISYVIAAQGPDLDSLAPGFDADTKIANLPSLLAMSPGDTGNLLYTSTLSAQLLNKAGFQSISILGHSGLVNVNPGVTLNVAPGGSISLTAGSIAVYGTLSAPAGTINLSDNGAGGNYIGALLADPTKPFAPQPLGITIGPDAILNTRGQWVNDAFLDEDERTGSEFINGGSISLATTASSVSLPLVSLGGGVTSSTTVDVTGFIDLQDGSVLDVSSGGYVQPNGQVLTKNGVVQGNAGSISLQTYTGGGFTGGIALPALPGIRVTSPDPARPGQFVTVTTPSLPTAGQVHLGATLLSDGFSGGGTFTLKAPQIQIGGDASSLPAYANYLSPDFFSNQGFGAYNLTSLFTTTVAAGTVLAPRERNLLPDLKTIGLTSTGSDVYAFNQIGMLDDYRRQPVNLSLSSGYYLNWTDGTKTAAFPGITGTMLVDEDAAIMADAGAAIALTSPDQITILGAISAPGGTITLSGTATALTANDTALALNSTRSVWLGSDSVLDVSGVSLIDDQAPLVLSQGGLMRPRAGKVLDGGTVSIVDDFGYVIAEKGAMINVSGTSDIYDIQQTAGGSLIQRVIYAPTLVWSDAGSIILGATSGMLFDGTLLAHGGAAQARGGSLTIDALGPNISASNNAAQGAQGILVQQSAGNIPAGLAPAARVETGGVSGILHFVADTLNGSGIENLTLQGLSQSGNFPSAATAVGFAGNVDISLAGSFVADTANFIALPANATTIPTLTNHQVSSGEGQIDISAGYVNLSGPALLTPVFMAGDATLNVSADTIDLTGAFALQNFADVNFTSAGDIRLYSVGAFGTGINTLSGEMTTSGNLTLKAAQVYPATANTFIIDANGDGFTDGSRPTTVRILPNGASSVPLSAGGSLLIDATVIDQEGTLRAPAGQIVLGVSDTTAQAAQFGGLPVTLTGTVTLGNGSVTSVSLEGATIPYGTTIDGKEWQFQIAGAIDTSFADLIAPPAKSVSINGNNVGLDKGAVVDISGGGDLQAQEWVPGTGGSRNVLAQENTVYSSGATPVSVPLYSDDRSIYAVIPGFKGLAPYDPSYSVTNTLVGKQVYLSGVPGLPAGTYTLLPAQYATQPGAYRVVQNTGVSDAVAGNNNTLADGTSNVAGYFVDGLTGAHDARTTSFTVQSRDVWRKYSEYDFTSADTFFPALAEHAGNAVPRLPVDAGRLSLGANDSLALGATIDAAPGTNGRGGQIDIASQAIQIVADSSQAQSGYLVLNVDDLSALGAASLLIGGQRSDTSDGEAIAVQTQNILVDTNADHPLTAPELILAAKIGITIDSDSVIAAKGDIAASSDEALSIGQLASGSTPAISGDGALLRVSNGAPVAITRSNVTGIDGPAGTAGGALTIQAGASIDGGQSLTLDATGDTVVDKAASFVANAIDVNSNRIAFEASDSSATPGGVVIGPDTLALFANAQTVGLHSRSTIDFFGDVSVDLGSDLTLGAGAFTSDGGSVTIDAPTVTFVNDLAAPVPTFASGGGALAVNANQVNFGAGDKTVQGFGAVNVTAANGIVGQGTGSFDFGSLPVTMTTPILIADQLAQTTLTTTGAMTVNAGAGTPLALSPLGGAITLTGGNLSENANIQANGGTVNLEATTGDLTLGENTTIAVNGIGKQFYDVTAYAPGGGINLISDNGMIVVPTGATLDFSAADGGGNAGSLSVVAPVQTAQLNGILKGGARNGTGGSFNLDIGGAVDLDGLSTVLASSGIDDIIAIHTRQGNLTLSSGNSLVAQNVSLTADGGTTPSDTADGHVLIAGTINASGTAGGDITLYGKGGVDVEGTLNATGSSADERGGNIILGTSGNANGGYNADYGYELVDAADSGSIVIGPHAALHVDGGTEAGLSGGTIEIRAPLLSNGDVNVSIDPNATITGARDVGLEAYVVWSTTDDVTQTGLAKHFDGLIDPAGWYNADGTMVAGTWTDQSGAPVSGAPDPTTDYFTPTGANTDHESFYGYINGDPTQGPGAVMGFIQAPNFTFENRFASIANFHARPGIELRNPDPNTNGGAISVLTNWNLGAGTANSDGTINYAFRYGDQAPILTLRAEGDIKVKASISDGFYEYAQGNPFFVSGIPYGDALQYLSNNAFNDLLPTGGFFSDDQNNPLFFTSWLAAEPATPAELGISGTQDGYYLVYEDYITAYDNFMFNNLFVFGNAGISSFAAPSETSAPGAPTAPVFSGTTLASYESYLTLYNNYANIDFPNYGFGAVSMLALPTPPAPPPFVSAPPTPGDNSVSPVASTINPAPLQMSELSPNPVRTGGTSSYRLVAGADFAATNPLDVKTGGAGDVTIDGHFTAQDISNHNPDITTPPLLSFPNMVRTGTGFIDVAAANDVVMLDQAAPGVIYTAGVPDTNAPQNNNVSITQHIENDDASPEVVVSGLVSPTGAGDISIHAGRDIDGGQFLVPSGGALLTNQSIFIGQTWWQWMETFIPADMVASPVNPGTNIGTSSGINFGGFDQGVMSVGGNVDVTAGRDIRDLAVSLPTTWYLSGDMSNPTVNTVGGGNLNVTAGRDILSGNYFVSKGTGNITAGGQIGSDFSYSQLPFNSTQAVVTTDIAPLLALQDATLNVSARQTVNIGQVYDPSWFSAENTANSSSNATHATDSTPFSADSTLNIVSTGGDVLFDTLRIHSALFGNTAYLDDRAPILPASLNLTALSGAISVDGPGELYPSTMGQLNLLADGSINFYNNVFDTGVSKGLFSFGMIDQAAENLPSVLNPGFAGNTDYMTDYLPFDRSPDALHATDPQPVRIYSLTGDIVDGLTDPKGTGMDGMALWFDKPAQIYAAGDIVNLWMFGENLDASDVTRISAGHDIYDQPIGISSDFHGFGAGDDYGFLPVIEIGGPGTLLVEAGRDIGPLASVSEMAMGDNDTNIKTAGNSPFDTGIQAVGDLYNGYLPHQSASVDVLFGVGPGIATADFASTYLDPASAAAGLPSYAPDLVSFMQQYDNGQWKKSGKTGSAPALSVDQAWMEFQALPDWRQLLLDQQVLFKVFQTVGADYNDPTSAFFHKYARGYDAINALFPASLGYTQNALEGGSNGANSLQSTGNLDMRSSTIQTREGGDISILGPGGSILVGSTSAPPYFTDQNGNTLAGPNQSGILTLESGDINVFSDQSLLLAQSRVFTEQGGAITMWSSNGDINAGKGAKTNSETPQPSYVCDPDGFCRVDPRGQVSGAGIGSLQTIPDAPTGDVFLIAPRGTVDAGDAGIRVSGDLFVAALAVANADNIQVQGKSVGLPPQPVTNLTLTTASTAATEAAQISNSMKAQQPQTSINVEVTGFGGDINQPDECLSNSVRPCK